MKGREEGRRGERGEGWGSYLMHRVLVVEKTAEHLSYEVTLIEPVVTINDFTSTFFHVYLIFMFCFVLFCCDLCVVTWNLSRRPQI